MKLKDNILNLFNKKEIKEIKTSVQTNKRTKNFFEFDYRTDYRVNSSIKKWRDGLNQAEDNEYPNRFDLLKVYNETVLDGIVKNSMDLRIQRILGMPFSIVNKADTINKKAQIIFEQYWFEKYLKFAMESIFYGHSLIQIDGVDKSGVTNVTLIPRENIVPEFGIFKSYANDSMSQGKDYMEPKIYKWLCEVYKTRKDLGLLNSVTSYQIPKKIGVLAWTQFVEKFGEPTVIGRTNSNLESEKKELKDFLTNLSMNSAAVLDKQTDIEFKETSRPDVFNVYKELITEMNNEINSIILGATEITSGGSGGSEARANVHMAQSNHKTSADIRFITNNINKVLIPRLVNLKVIPKGLKFKFDIDELLSVKERIEIDRELLKSYKLSKDYIEKTYQVEIEEDTKEDIEQVLITEDDKLEDVSKKEIEDVKE